MPHAKELFPLGEPNEAEPWLGRRPNMPDSLPVLGRAPGQNGLWLAFGHGHWGLTLGPVTGRLIADMMTGATPFADPRPIGRSGSANLAQSKSGSKPGRRLNAAHLLCSRRHVSSSAFSCSDCSRASANQERPSLLSSFSCFGLRVTVGRGGSVSSNSSMRAFCRAPLTDLPGASGNCQKTMSRICPSSWAMRPRRAGPLPRTRRAPPRAPAHWRQPHRAP